MHRRFSTVGRLTALLVLGGGTALVAQTGSGTLSVIAKDSSGKPLAGVRITLRSEKLQGDRSGVTDAQGIYRAPLLPPGAYTGVVALDGYKTGSLSAVVPLGGSTSVDAILRKADAAEAVVTVIGTQGKVEKTEVSVTENYTQEDILKLPVGRTLAGVTQLAPGVTTGAGGRAVIGGSASYENKFLVNGADVNDNYFGTDTGLFIEDAIDETQVLTNGVSAEFGRFTGGVVNALTKRGGNTFEGSVRAVLTNNNWNAVLPDIKANAGLGIPAVNYRKGIVNKVNKTYVATVGGPIVKDVLWFFFAGRSTKTDNAVSLPGTGAQVPQGVEETRYEINTTWQINASHRFLAAYTSREIKTSNSVPLVNNTADPAGLRHRKDPLSLMTLQYDGILSSNMNLNVTYTEKKQKITTTPNGSPGNNGGTAFWQSPIYDPTGLLFNNMYFGFDPEERNNNSIKAVLSLYLPGAGQHQVKIGFEQFKEINIASNQQSPTGFVYDSSGVDYTNLSAPTYTFDADSYIEDWSKAPGGKFTSTYNSFFVNDNWTFDNHLNFSLGARLEKWEGSQGNALYAKPSFQDVTPRIGINYDPIGDGSWQYSLTYATYAGKANASIVTAGTYVGNPALYQYAYTGPDVTGVTPSPTTTGFRRSDYSNTPFLVQDATLNTKLSDNFKAPLTIEYTFGIKHKISDASNFTLLYIYRNQTRMFEDYIGMNGSVNIGGSPYSIIQWGNTGSDAMRVYKALQGTWETSSELYGGKLYVRGNATLSTLEGNYEGDGGNSPGGGTAIGNYPLAAPNSAAVSYGKLANDEPLRIKTQILWSRPIGANTLALGFNWDYSSGHPYSLTRTAYYSDPTSIYPDATGNTYTKYYGTRGQARFADINHLDFSAQWDGKIGPKTGPTARLGYFIKLTAFNALNNIQKATWNTDGNTTRVNVGTPISAGASADAWIARSRFGQNTSPAQFVGNRQIQLDLGFKF
ncbi:MAG: TonB-dependent receptor [Acidobacteria bacterium]|nr:TonB-dependent receptor [Acidobacteriota bacterium]MBI3487067.1 TonB-dependent receptor [Acidobacteriota bacterium]